MHPGLETITRVQNCTSRDLVRRGERYNPTLAEAKFIELCYNFFNDKLAKQMARTDFVR